MLALSPLRPLDSMLASTNNYLPQQALHLAVPPVPGPSDYPATTSSIWSALSFYEPVPRAISPASPAATAQNTDSHVVYSTPSVSRWDHLITQGDDSLLHPNSHLEPRRRPSPIPPRCAPTPFSDASHLPSSHRPPPSVSSPDDAAARRGNADLALSRPEYEHERVPASGLPASSAPPFLCRSVPLPAPSSPMHVTSSRRARPADLPEPSSSFGIQDLSRVLLSDPDLGPTVTESESEFDRKFVPLAPHRRKVKKTRGPYARSAAEVQRLLPPFGAPRCQHADLCTDAKCTTCAYLRRRGDSALRTKLLKRDKDRDLWHLHTAVHVTSDSWPYAEDRWKLQALQASYVLGRELALQARKYNSGCRSRARL